MNTEGNRMSITVRHDGDTIKITRPLDNGAVTNLMPDGSARVDLRTQRLVELYPPPSAIDGTGMRVSTWYTLEDGFLVQHLDACEVRAWPITVETGLADSQLRVDRP